MNDEIDIESWTSSFADNAVDVFGPRLKLVGIQGSRARGEARPGSDIDVVLVVEGLGGDDFAVYRALLATMPHGDLACGFTGSPELLVAWPRHDVFNLVMDTRVVLGSFDFMDTDFTAEDAILSAKVGASEIYHAISHELVFAEDSLNAIVAACVKSAFFVMRALRYAKTGEYPPSRAVMREHATSQEAMFLDAYDDSDAFETEKLAQALLAWASSVVIV